MTYDGAERVNGVCVCGEGKRGQHNGDVTDRPSTSGGRMMLQVYQPPRDRKPTLWVVDAVTKLGMWQHPDTMLTGCIYISYIHISSLMLIHKHTHEDNRKIEEGRPYL